MTLKELLEKLSKYPPESIIVNIDNAGFITKTSGIITINQANVHDGQEYLDIPKDHPIAISIN